MALEIEAQVRALVAENPSLSVHDSPTSPTTTTTPAKHPPELDALLAPLGGGGLISGLALALAPSPTKLFGAEPSHQGADDARRGLAQGARIEHVSTLTIADGLRTPLGEVNWGIISRGHLPSPDPDPGKVAAAAAAVVPAEQAKGSASGEKLVEAVFAVSDAQILQALRLVMERVKIFVEPSAVVGVAVALFDEGFRKLVEREGGEEGWDLGVVVSGGNVGVEALGGWFGGVGGGREGGEKRAGKGGEGKGEGEEREGGRDEGTVGFDGGRVAEDVAG